MSDGARFLAAALTGWCAQFSCVWLAASTEDWGRPGAEQQRISTRLGKAVGQSNPRGDNCIVILWLANIAADEQERAKRDRTNPVLDRIWTAALHRTHRHFSHLLDVGVGVSSQSSRL